MRPKKLQKLNPEVEIFRLLFDTRDVVGCERRRNNVQCARVILPLVNATLSEVKKSDHLSRYRFFRVNKAVEPVVGMLVGYNKLQRLGSHFSWSFYEIVNITANGRIMVMELQTVSVHGHRGNDPNSHSYSRSFVAPGARVAGRGKKVLPARLYDVYDVEEPSESTFYNGGCVN